MKPPEIHRPQKPDQHDDLVKRIDRLEGAQTQAVETLSDQMETLGSQLE